MLTDTLDAAVIFNDKLYAKEWKGFDDLINSEKKMAGIFGMLNDGKGVLDKIRDSRVRTRCPAEPLTYLRLKPKSSER